MNMEKKIRKKNTVSKCKELADAGTKLGTYHVAAVSYEKINSILDDASSEIVDGVFVAPLFRGSWGACAHIQIEPQKSHGPYINSAEYMIVRVFACSEPDENRSSVSIKIGSSPEQYISQGMDLNKFKPNIILTDEYFQISQGVVYTIHNKSFSEPVMLTIQLFNETKPTSVHN